MPANGFNVVHVPTKRAAMPYAESCVRRELMSANRLQHFREADAAFLREVFESQILSRNWNVAIHDVILAVGCDFARCSLLLSFAFLCCFGIFEG